MNILEILGALTLLFGILFAILFSLNIIKVEKMHMLVEDEDQDDEVVGYTTGITFYRGGHYYLFEEDDDE